MKTRKHRKQRSKNRLYFTESEQQLLFVKSFSNHLQQKISISYQQHYPDKNREDAILLMTGNSLPSMPVNNKHNGLVIISL